MQSSARQILRVCLYPLNTHLLVQDLVVDSCATCMAPVRPRKIGKTSAHLRLYAWASARALRQLACVCILVADFTAAPTAATLLVADLTSALIGSRTPLRATTRSANAVGWVLVLTIWRRQRC